MKNGGNWLRIITVRVGKIRMCSIYPMLLMNDMEFLAANVRRHWRISNGARTIYTA